MQPSEPDQQSEHTDPADASGEPRDGEMLGAPRAGASGTTEKDPGDWVTGDEPMTGAQRSYLDTLARQAGEQLSPDMTKAEASEHIERLQREAGQNRSE